METKEKEILYPIETTLNRSNGEMYRVIGRWGDNVKLQKSETSRYFKADGSEPITLKVDDITGWQRAATSHELKQQVDSLRLENDLLHKQVDKLLASPGEQGISRDEFDKVNERAAKLAAEMADVIGERDALKRKVADLQKAHDKQAALIKASVDAPRKDEANSIQLHTLVQDLTTPDVRAKSDTVLSRFRSEGWTVASNHPILAEGKLQRIVTLELHTVLVNAISPDAILPMTEAIDDAFENALKGNASADEVIEAGNAQVISKAKEAAESHFDNSPTLDKPLLEA